MAALGSETDSSLGKISRDLFRAHHGRPPARGEFTCGFEMVSLERRAQSRRTVVEILALVRQTMVRLAAGKTSTAPNSRFSHDTVV